MFIRLGAPVREFYQVPKNLDKPVGSRVLPDIESKRTGVVYAPGAILEVIQEVSMDGIRYLRTEDKKGWVFAYHPKLQITMLEPVHGEYLIENATLRCISESDKVPIREGPGLLSKACGDGVYPGEEVQAVARWRPDDGSGRAYLKLGGGKGWVQLHEEGSEKALLFQKI